VFSSSICSFYLFLELSLRMAQTLHVARTWFSDLASRNRVLARSIPTTADGFNRFVIKVFLPRSKVMGMRDDALTIESFPGAIADTTVFRLTGPITLSSLFSLRDELAKTSSRVTVLDMSQVPYVDSAGLGTILMFYVSAQKNERKLALAGVTERVMSLIRMTRVDTVLSMFPNVEAAEQAS
jgi:anti-anti-sigma factor